jgi:hypothetical protein
MALLQVGDSFHVQLSKEQTSLDKNTSNREKLDKWKFSTQKNLHHYMLQNIMCYDDMGAITFVDSKGQGSGKYPRSAWAVWNAIATTMSDSFNKDRAGKAVPKAKAPDSFLPPVNPLMPAPIPTAKLIKLDTDFLNPCKEQILKWFMENYDEALERGEKGKPTGKIKTSPSKSKAVAKKITKLFNDYYKKCQWGANGITLPSIVLDKMKTRPFPEYMPYCKPHKDAIGATDNTYVGQTTVRRGPEGYVVGPFEANIQMVEIENEKMKIKDNSQEEEVPVFREDPTNIDQNEFLIDNDFYQSKIKDALGAGFDKFRTQVAKTLSNVDDDGNYIKEPSGLPIDDKEIVIPSDDPDVAPKSLDTLAGGKKVFNLDRRGKGFTSKGGGGGLLNPGYNKPIVDGAYGGAIFTEEIDVRDWKYTNGSFVIYQEGADMGLKWGGPRVAKAFPRVTSENVPVKCYMKFEKEKDGTGADDKSFSDPRTWGPWEEYEGTAKKTGADPSDKATGLDKLKYKFITPTRLGLATGAPDTSIPHKTINGLPGFDKPALPAMNKQYWGLRVLEAFPNVKGSTDAQKLENAIGEALKPPPKPKTTGVPIPIPGTAGIAPKGVGFVGGPAPPFVVKEKGSGKRTWEFSNTKVLQGLSGKVSRTNGQPFNRGKSIGKDNIKRTYKFSKNNKGVSSKIDKKIKGQAKGGMTWFDPVKQIIPPFAPPPLKPPLPNSKTFKWG